MKQDKALMQINGESLLSRQHRVLSHVLGSENVYVSGRRPGYMYIEDQEQGLGPVEGLRSACDFFIRTTDYQSLILLPVDMPFLDEEILTCLLDPANNDVDLIRFQDYQLPILFNDIYKLQSVIESLKTNCQITQWLDGIEKYKFSFKELFKCLKSYELKVNNRDYFKNINTPEDFYAAISKTNIAFANR